MKKYTFISFLFATLLIFSGCTQKQDQQPVTPENNTNITDITNTNTNTDNECVINTDCETPMEYMLRSNCPFQSKCIEGKCNVVCVGSYRTPQDELDITPQCKNDNECDCSIFYTAKDMAKCACIDNFCTAIVAEQENNIEQNLSFTDQINQALKNGATIEEVPVDTDIITLPPDIDINQIQKYFEIGDILFALVLKNSMNVVLDLPTNFTPTFTGVLIANKRDNKWSKYIEIKDAAITDKNNPYYLFINNGNLLLTVVDQNGAGSGEGLMKVFKFSETGEWQLINCYDFVSYGDPTHGDDYFAASVKFENQIKKPISKCSNVQLIIK